MKSKLRIGVVFGGRSGEHEVSLVSATSVMNALDPEKYEVVPIGIAPDGRWLSSGRALGLLKEKGEVEREIERFLVPEPNRQALISVNGWNDPALPIDVVFPLVHGTFGEDGSLQGLLELADIAYVGAGVLGSAAGMDKIVQKELFRRAGLRTAQYCWLLSREYREKPKYAVARIERQLRYPMFVKPANTGSSVGISKAHNRLELHGGLACAAEYDRKIIVEQGIPGAREIECSILGNDEPMASVPGEVISSNEFYDYEAKYVDGKSKVIIPAKLPKRIVGQIRESAILAFRTLDCAGMARVDFFLKKKELTLFINELNTIPGFTSISMYTKLWEASGISFTELLDRLIMLAIERHREKNKLKRTYHPRRDWYRS